MGRGSWTNVIDRDDQIWTISGSQVYATYRIGDTVAWSIDQNHPGEGELLDGAYEVERHVTEDDAFWIEEDTTKWLLIVDHKVVGLIDRGSETEQEIIEQLRIKPYERSWWPHTAWRRQELEEAEFELESAQYRLKCAQEDLNLTDEEKRTRGWERLGEVMGMHIWSTLGREGFARRLLRPTGLCYKCQTKTTKVDSSGTFDCGACIKE